MKWRWRKRRGHAKIQKENSAPRLTTGRRRLTGAARELPRGLHILMNVTLTLVLLAVLTWGGKILFYFYFRMNPEFRLKNLSENVIIKTGKMVTPEVIIERFGLKEGVSLFSLNIEKGRENLLRTPNVRDISIERRLPDKLFVTVIEREPVARVKPIEGWVVDEEGVVFIRSAGTGHLPLIRLSGKSANVKPGRRLDGMEMAAIRVVRNAMRPGFRLRLAELDTRHQDYLLLTFSDLRKAKFAWPGMLAPPCRENDARMQRQLNQLEQAMESRIGRPRKMWDATQPNRPVAMPGTG